MLPPSQHIVSLLAGARILDLTSLGKNLLSSLMNLSGNPVNIVLPPDNTISLYKVVLRSISTLFKLLDKSWTMAILKQ